jgi:hypothetical protein
VSTRDQPDAYRRRDVGARSDGQSSASESRFRSARHAAAGEKPSEVRYDIDETQTDAETMLSQALWLSSWIMREP